VGGFSRTEVSELEERPGLPLAGIQSWPVVNSALIEA